MRRLAPFVLALSLGACDWFTDFKDQPRIEHYTRQPDGSWTYRSTNGLDGVVQIPSIGCTLKLAEVYDRVVFGQE